MFKTKKKTKIAAICLAVIVAGVALVGAASANGNEIIPEETRKDIIVDTVSPEIGNIVVIGEYIGTMEPSQQITVFPKASGEVLSVNFNVGDSVKAGDVLFEIDSTTLRSNISQTQASLSAAQARANQNLSVAQDSLETQQFNVAHGHDNTMKNAQNAIDNAQTGVENAENRLATARLSLTTAQRQLREYRDDGVLPISMASMQQMQYEYEDQIDRQLRDAVTQARLSVDSAVIGLEQAKDSLTKAQEGYATATIMVQDQMRSIENQIENARLGTNFSDQQIALQRLQNDLSNYSVTAPISGIVERRSIEPFNMASPQSPAFVISDKESMTATFKISRESHKHLNIGDEVTVKDNGSTFTGTITEISTMVDQSGLFTINATIPNPPDYLHTGASVKVFAVAQSVENAITIPLTALYYDNGEPFVYIADNGFAKKVDVEIGIFDAHKVQIVSGVSLSDQIIITWSSSLGDNVEIVLVSNLENAERTEGTDISADDADAAKEQDKEPDEESGNSIDSKQDNEFGEEMTFSPETKEGNRE